MTTVVDAPTTPERPTLRSARIVGQVAVRWVAIIVMTGIAYHKTIAAVVIEMGAQTLLVYLPVAMFLVFAAALGVSLRNDDELPIYDRQTDVIVGGVLLILAVSLQAMLNERYSGVYLAVHIDLLSMWTFVLGAFVLVFGIRPTARYRWVWLLGLSVFPLPFRVLVLAFGSERYASGIAVLLLAIACSAVAVGRSRSRAAVGALMAAASGGAVLALIAVLRPDFPRFGYMAVPSLVAMLSTGAVMYVDQRRDSGSLRPYPHRRVNNLTAANVWTGVVMLAVASILISLARVPSVRVQNGVAVEGLPMDLPLEAPVGWRQVDMTPLGFDRLYGSHARSVRQTIVQTRGDLRYDKSARPRYVVVDTVVTDRPITLDVYLPPIVYDTTDDRTSAKRFVDLGHAITGTLQTVVDDKRVLTFNRLSWRWHNNSETMQVTLFSVDNHLPGAPFPQPARGPLQVINPLVTILLRGNAVTVDETPSFKDEDLLTSTARGIVDTRLAAIGER